MSRATQRRIPLDRRAAIEAIGLGDARPRRPGRPLPAFLFPGALLLALLCVLPQAWGFAPLPWRLGDVPARDLVARVSFDWRDSAEEKRLLEAVDRTWPRRYREASRWDWTLHVWGPLSDLLERATSARDGAEIAKLAETKGVTLPTGGAEILRQTLAGRGGRIYQDLAVPVQAVLRETLFRRGVLAPDRWEAEQRRRIRILDRDGRERFAEVETGNPEGPLPVTAAGACLADSLGEDFARADLDIRLLPVLCELLQKRIGPSLVFDRETSEAETARERARILDRTRRVTAGDVLAARGERLRDAATLRKIRAETLASREAQGATVRLGHLGGKTVLLFLVFGGFGFYLHRQRPAGLPGRAAAGTAGLILAAIHLGQAGGALGLPPAAVPGGFLAGALALGLGEGAGLLAAGALALAGAFLNEGQSGAAAAQFLAGALFACILRPRRRRTSILFAALGAGAAGGIAGFAWDFALGAPPTVLLDAESLLAGTGLPGGLLAPLVGWALSGLAIVVLLPWIEPVFGAVPAVRLQALQDRDHPVLRLLTLQAPGTYHHSALVATLAEAAAEEIGADGLLARVGAFYHDIGKLMKPEYFTENEGGRSRHDSLSPFLSTLIILAHVKDGAEMAREYGLPRGVIDILEQHHGRSLVSYFHHRAREAEGAEEVHEQAFRYPGPLPQSPEAALVMLADSVEAATRSLDRPTPAHLRRLIGDIVAGRLRDGQLAESGLTFAQLTRIEESFFRLLSSVLHSRVRYPSPEGR